MPIRSDSRIDHAKRYDNRGGNSLDIDFFI